MTIMFRPNASMTKYKWVESNVEAAVANSCVACGWVNEVETAQDTADKAAVILGKLVDLLTRKGVLTEMEVFTTFLDPNNYKVDP